MAANPRILKTDVPPAPVDPVRAVYKVAQMTGRAPHAIVAEMTVALLGPRKLSLSDYFALGGWRGDRENRNAVIGSRASEELARSLIARGVLNQSALLDDKYLTSVVLSAHGFPVPHTKAGFGTRAPFGRLPTLTTVAALTGWLTDPANLPAFGKPTHGARSLGAIPLLATDGTGIDIGEGVVPARALAEEVAQAFPNGWILQDQMRHPPEVEALIGPGIGSARIVSLWGEDGPALMYGVWRIPTVGTWVDATIHDRPNVFCALDHDGTVVRAQLGYLLDGREITHSLVTPDLPLVGFRLPEWPKMLSLCLEAHRLFPGHALIGWDVVMTGDGPILSEMNVQPLHMLIYQRAFGQGFLHADHRARLDVAQRLVQERAGVRVRKKGT